MSTERYELHLRTIFEALRNTSQCTNLLGLFALYANTTLNRDVKEMFVHLCCKYQWQICEGNGLAEYRDELMKRLGQELGCINTSWWKATPILPKGCVQLEETHHLDISSFQGDSIDDALTYLVKVRNYSELEIDIKK